MNGLTPEEFLEKCRAKEISYPFDLHPVPGKRGSSLLKDSKNVVLAEFENIVESLFWIKRLSELITLEKIRALLN